MKVAVRARRFARCQVPPGRVCFCGPLWEEPADQPIRYHRGYLWVTGSLCGCPIFSQGHASHPLFLAVPKERVPASAAKLCVRRRYHSAFRPVQSRPPPRPLFAPVSMALWWNRKGAAQKKISGRPRPLQRAWKAPAAADTGTCVATSFSPVRPQNLACLGRYLWSPSPARVPGHPTEKPVKSTAGLRFSRFFRSCLSSFCVFSPAQLRLPI